MRLTLNFFAAALSFSSVFAQDSLAVSDHAKSTAIVWKLSRELNLTKEQETEVYDVMMRRWSALEEARTGRGIAARQSVTEATLFELRSILTADQLAKFMKLREENSKMKREYRSSNPGYVMSETDMDLEL